MCWSCGGTSYVWCGRGWCGLGGCGRTGDVVLAGAVVVLAMCGAGDVGVVLMVAADGWSCLWC